MVFFKPSWAPLNSTHHQSWHRGKALYYLCISRRSDMPSITKIIFWLPSLSLASSYLILSQIATVNTITYLKRRGKATPKIDGIITKFCMMITDTWGVELGSFDLPQSYSTPNQGIWNSNMAIFAVFCCSLSLKIYIIFLHYLDLYLIILSYCHQFARVYGEVKTAVCEATKAWNLL